jgi:hypothetical protein
MTIDFLFEDYKLKLDYLRYQYDRMWGRFNFFLTVELAIFGLLGYLTFDKQYPDATRFPIALGILVSVLWYIVGAEDRALVEVYGERARTAASRIAKAPEGLANYDLDHAAAEIGVRKGFRSWYWPWLSITRIPVTLALLLIAIWLGLLATWKPVADRAATFQISPNTALQLEGASQSLECLCTSRSPAAERAVPGRR